MTAQLFRIPFNTNMTNTVRYIRYWEAYQRCTDVIYRRIPIFSTHRCCLFSFCSFIRCQHFVRAYGKIFICLKYVCIKIHLWKPKVDRHPAHGLEHYSLLSGYRFFSNTNMIKKIFLFADRCTRKRSLQISMKRNPEYTGEDSPVSISLFSVSTASAQILWRKKYFFAVFLKT